jgi:hypothetical protein
MFLNERMRLKAKAIPSIESTLSRLLQTSLKHGGMARAQTYWIKVWYVGCRSEDLIFV